MAVYHNSFKVKNDKNKEAFYDITSKVKEIVSNSSVKNGRHDKSP